MNTAAIIARASQHLRTLPGTAFDEIRLSKPASTEAAVNLARVVSKLSPLVGNLIEFNTCQFLNAQREFQDLGKWRRQDPGFPDIVFDSVISPAPGFEIKAWFPLATEITARFRDSRNHFDNDRTHVAMIAWLPEFVIFGRPKIIDVVIASGQSIAMVRDTHYHNPPDYLVLEPENTARRAKNLQQTNTSGYKWQRVDNDLQDAVRLKEVKKMIRSWGKANQTYSSSAEYQARLKKLMGSKFSNYRLDTNYAKIDRIGHPDIDAFAQKIYATPYQGLSVGEWNSLLSKGREADVKQMLAQKLGVTHG